MKFKSLVCLVLLFVAATAAFSQDAGNPDSIKLVVLTGAPQVGLPTQPFNVACSVKVDADNISSITMGWKWDNIGLHMDSAKAFGEFNTEMNLKSYFLDDQLATTNDSQIALCDGVSFAANGYPPAAGWRHAVTYYMTLTNWSAARSTIHIDTIQHPSYSSTEYLFVTTILNSYKPGWGGPINLSSTAVDESNTSIIPTTFELQQNYPNPFNPTTMIRFGLPTKSQVTLKIFNLLGQEVTTLVDEVLPAGTHSTEWDGRDQAGVEVATGIYFYKLVAGDFIETKKMMLVK